MDAKRDDYAARGYFIERGLLSAATVERLKRRIAAVLEVGSLDDVVFDAARAGGDDPMGPERFRKVSALCRRYREVWDEFVAAPRAIALDRELVGDNVRQWFNAVFTKPAEVGEATPWHQDIGLWTQRPATRHLRPLYRDALSFWVALDPATRENGCLQVVPGSHRGQPSRWTVSWSETTCGSGSTRCSPSRRRWARRPPGIRTSACGPSVRQLAACGRGTATPSVSGWRSIPRRAKTAACRWCPARTAARWWTTCSTRTRCTWNCRAG
jgi:hypothetical protein